ncbi:MAG: hypothetical protein BJ554DRAFT_3374, partial [Olpidium bornovanus]
HSRRRLPNAVKTHLRLTGQVEAVLTLLRPATCRNRFTGTCSSFVRGSKSTGPAAKGEWGGLRYRANHLAGVVNAAARRSDRISSKLRKRLHAGLSARPATISPGGFDRGVFPHGAAYRASRSILSLFWFRETEYGRPRAGFFVTALDDVQCTPCIQQIYQP